MKPEELRSTKDPEVWAKHFINAARDLIGGRGLRATDNQFVKEWFLHALAEKNPGDVPMMELVESEPDPKLAAILQEVQTLRREVNNFMKSLADVLADVQEEKTQIDSLVKLVAGLKSQVNAVPGLTADQQAQIDSIFAAVEANKQEVTDAINANTPAAPPAAASGA